MEYGDCYYTPDDEWNKNNEFFYNWIFIRYVYIKMYKIVR